MTFTSGLKTLAQWFCAASILTMLFVGTAAQLCLAQTGSATLSGTITDKSGALVAEASVEVMNQDTGTSIHTRTNGAGVYSVPGLKPGLYKVSVEKEGFKRVAVRDITLNVQDVVSRNFTLDVGAMSETVEVTGASLNINTSDGSVSTVVDQTYIKNMPLNGRSFQDLILLTPGVVTQSPQTSLGVTGSGLGQVGEFSVNGQRPEENYYTVDGVNANSGASPGFNLALGAGASGSLGGATALGTTQALVSVDELQEFRVQSSTYSAEYGRTPGGQFAFETKSGSNQFHGTAYDYLRNNFFDAPDWFNDFFSVKEPSMRQNDFGGTLGGPLRIPGVYNGKDKTFFFFNYEGLRLAAPQAANINYVPDAALRSSTPAPLQQVMNAFPVANGPDQGNGLAEYIAAWDNRSSIDSTSFRLDQVIKDKARIFFRFSNTDSQSATRQNYFLSGGVPSVNDTPSYKMRTYTAGATALITSHVSNDLRLNYTSNETTDSAVIDNFGGATPADLAQLAGLDSRSQVSIFLPLFVTLTQQYQAGAQRQWNLVDTMSWSRGQHQLKFGGDYRRSTPFFVPTNPGVGYGFFSAGAVMNNNADFISTNVNAQGYPLYENLSVFAEDEWRTSQRLSVSFGLRWELDPAPGVTQGPRPYTVAFQPDPNNWTFAPLGAPLWKTTWYNFAPRLGAAYVLHSSAGRETVTRGGGGVFFDTGQQTGSMGMVNAPGFTNFGPFGSSGPFPGPVNVPCTSAQMMGQAPGPCLPALNPPSPFSTVSAFWPHLQLPYTLQWNASLEQALGKSQTVTLSYLGAHASRLLKTDVYQPPNNQITFFGFNVASNGLTSDYNSAQAQYRRNLSQRLTALASYTWSHCIDYNSQNYLFGYQRGNCSYDVRHNLSGAFSYDVPNVGHNTFVNALLHHWGLDNRFTARTGFPITINGNGNFNPATGKELFSGVNFDSTKPVYVTQCVDPRVPQTPVPVLMPCPGGRGINAAAFTLPANNQLGNAPRNFVRGLGAWQMDIAVRREFPIYENLKLQFRAEAFNVFNHPNFGTINPFLGQTTFGEAQQTLASSLGVLSPIYQMGGARSMQFALKAIF
jgi:Carboxypeptidase regulatory-like domain